MSAEQVLRLLPPQQQQGSPGADRGEVPKQAQREPLSASYSNWQQGLPQAQAEGTTAREGGVAQVAKDPGVRRGHEDPQWYIRDVCNTSQISYHLLGDKNHDLFTLRVQY